ncbi:MULTISPECIES: hypothetical protein [Legionella]|uniref:HEPN domain-containing protein n=1 Tax=Legionella donaldsonii TaxID=45060 RepID=A0A378IY91_9GAMM|nr:MULTISPECIES: hypothetical protein [Legionella]MCC5014574.1 hypothetical protein [Legionella sp. 31fI33]STX40422.1 Uncharacterised protein [Legionella donaldsonii]
MDKRFFSPLELMRIATEHAYCAEYLLPGNAKVTMYGDSNCDTLAAITTLMYAAFELTFKAYLLHEHKKNNQHKNLMELLESGLELELSHEDRKLLKYLARHQAFRKGVDYELWEDRQDLHGFCVEIIELYERVQQLMPIELQSEYQSV